MVSSRFVLRWWPIVYVVGLGAMGVIFASGQGRTPPVPGPAAGYSLIAASLLLLYGTVREDRATFTTGMLFATFGLMFRAWDLVLYPGTVAQRILGPVVYGLAAVGLALCTMLTARTRT